MTIERKQVISFSGKNRENDGRGKRKLFATSKRTGKSAGCELVAREEAGAEPEVYRKTEGTETEGWLILALRTDRMRQRISVTVPVLFSRRTAP